MEGGEDLSIDELASNLSTYKDQLREIKKLLADEPGNAEYADMEKELEEVIALTEELLATAKQAEATQHDSDESNEHSLSHKFSVGTKVQAVWSEDGEWYDATIESLTPNGYYVYYDEWGNKEEVDPDNVRPIQEGVVDALEEAEKEAEATRQAIKRKIAQAAVTDFQMRSLPAKLRIEPNDPDDLKAAKRKKIHAFKSKLRFEQLEVVQNKRQNAWQQFQTTKGKAKKVGFFQAERGRAYSSPPTTRRGRSGSPEAEGIDGVPKAGKAPAPEG
uniref:Survival of motor neuron-related-splicing factor 30 n=1 Tax=Ananas comosus var. bracteatus TaxID=296719 RepID=A0A6V7NIP6_ANACO|nr:unnamed protein product [Ananas comosus var. bracteatus]